MERFELGLREAMPYADASLLVGEFRGTSQSPLLWTRSDVMAAWVTTRRLWGEPIYLPYAFRRIWEGGHSYQSQHYAGTAFDCAQNLSSQRREALRALAEGSGLWTYVEPAPLAPAWVHMDLRTLPPVCPGGGYPLLRMGSIGVYVCILQDALNTAEGAGIEIDGIFGIETNEALNLFQAVNGLTADGMAGCATWQLLTALTRGVGYGG
ncbi:MAG: peptidoglycan-binding protein [Oscillospiraceae bacterium]|jgi:peptidoglycan hydrolase-like protein with peptidoglycan-binding domain|nr:peptidoglycan-binding protein [Oscillospiraceae bacterium]